MKCAWIQWLLLTDAPLAGAALRHAEVCPACRAIAARQAWLGVALRQTAALPVPPDSLARCLRGVRERIVLAQSAPRTGWRVWLTLPVPVPVMAVIALAVVTMLGVGLLLRSPAESSAPQVRLAFAPLPSNAPAERWVKLATTSNNYLPVAVWAPVSHPSPAVTISNPCPAGGEYGPGATRPVNFNY